MNRYEPLVSRLDGLIDGILSPAFVVATDAAPAPRPFRVDVKETASAYILAAELPGVARDGIEVEIDGTEVSIRAESRREEAKDGDKWLRVERACGRSARRFALPQEVDEARAQARFVNGVLELTLPKKAAAAARKVTVQ